MKQHIDLGTEEKLELFIKEYGKELVEKQEEFSLANFVDKFNKHNEEEAK